MSSHVYTMTYMNTATCVHYHMGTDTWSVCRTQLMRDVSGEAACAHCTSGSHKQPSKSKVKHVDRFSLKQLNSPASAECRMQVCRASGCGVPTVPTCGRWRRQAPAAQGKGGGLPRLLPYLGGISLCVLAVPKQYHYWPPNSTTTAYPPCTVDGGCCHHSCLVTYLTHTSALR
jgi:hypothetical protein